jgi:acyl-coenzyme A synthetase/AMP-(fatty) acid ligase
LRRWCKERIASYKVPDGVRFVEELPQTAMGKVDRTLLARLARG